FRQWEGADRFWNRSIYIAILGPRPGGWPLQLPVLESYEPARAAARWIPRLAAPPTAAIVAFAGVYALIFGPLNIWLLRRLRRTVRAWLLMPSLAFGMTFVLLLAGQSWGTNRTILNAVTLLEAASGSLSARQQTLLGLFSPTNRA